MSALHYFGEGDETSDQIEYIKSQKWHCIPENLCGEIQKVPGP